MNFGNYNKRKDIPASLELTKEEIEEAEKFEKNVIYQSIFEQEKNGVYWNKNYKIIRFLSFKEWFQKCKQIYLEKNQDNSFNK